MKTKSGQLDDLRPTETESSVSKKIVVAIDDEADILKLYQTFLTHSGFEVHIADNAVAGFELLKSKSPDIVLLDINMPGIDGLTTLQLIRGDQKTKDSAVIMVSARRDEFTVKEALRMGCDNFLVKPFKLKELAERLSHETKVLQEAEVRHFIRPPIMLSKAPDILKEPGLMDLSPNLFEAYSVQFEGLPGAIVTPKGVRPEIFHRSLSSDMERSLTVYLKFGRRWRKVWPLKKPKSQG